MKLKDDLNFSITVCLFSLGLMLMALLSSCSTLPHGTTVEYHTNSVLVAVQTEMGAVAPTHEVRREEITMTLKPKKGQGRTNVVSMAPPLPAPPLPDLSRPMPMRVPAFTNLPLKVKSAASLPPLPPPRVSTPLKVFSLVCSPTQGGMLYSTNGLASGLVFAPSSNSISGVTVITPAGQQQIHFPPVPVTPRRTKSLIVTPGGPVLGIPFSVPFDDTSVVVFVDFMNLKSATIYLAQQTLDLKLWATFTQVNWTETDPSAYWRVGLLAPKNDAFAKAFRAKTQ